MLDLTTATPEQLKALEPGEFIAVVKTMSDGELGALMRGPNRAPIVENVFERMPQIFRPERAGDARALTHWTITERPDGGEDRYTVAVADGTCRVTEGHEGDASLSLTLTPVAFVKIISKSGNPVMMFMTGKLKASGDLGLAASIAGWFEPPTA